MSIVPIESNGKEKSVIPNKKGNWLKNNQVKIITENSPAKSYPWLVSFSKY